MVANSSSAHSRGEFVPQYFGSWQLCQTCPQTVFIKTLLLTLYYTFLSCYLGNSLGNEIWTTYCYSVQLHNCHSLPWCKQHNSFCLSIFVDGVSFWMSADILIFSCCYCGVVDKKVLNIRISHCNTRQKISHCIITKISTGLSFLISFSVFIQRISVDYNSNFTNCINNRCQNQVVDSLFDSFIMELFQIFGHHMYWDMVGWQ